jgi:hypothetical protein
MPSFSATDRAPTTAGITPLATRASHPSAVAATLSNQVAINSAVSRGTSSGDGGVAPCTSARTGSPTGTSSTPTSASRSAQSGGAHTSASAPSSCNRTASAASGSTPPRESYVDNSTRISRSPFRGFRARPAIMRHDRGLAASPGVRYRLKVARSGISLSFLLPSLGSCAVLELLTQ